MSNDTQQAIPSIPEKKPATLMQRFGSAARLLVGLGLIVWIVYSYRDAFISLNAADIVWPMLVAGVAGCVVMTLMTFVRWYLLVTVTGLPFTLRDAIVIGSIGYAFNFLLPGAVGGDLVKAVMMAKRQEKRGVAITTIGMDRIVGMVGLVVVAGLSGAFWLYTDGGNELIREIAVWVLWALPVALLGVVFMLSKTICENPLTDWIRGLRLIGPIATAVLEAFAAYRARPGIVLASILISIAGHLMLIFSFWCMSESMTPGGSPIELHMLIAPLGLIGGALPLTPGGLGVLELAMTNMYEYAGLNGGTAVRMVMAYRIAQIVIAIGGLLLYKIYREKLTTVHES